MWKYVALLALLLVGVASADTCVDCYANVIVQDDTQTIKDVDFQTGNGGGDPSVGNDAMSAAVIMTPKNYKFVSDTGFDVKFIDVGFAKIEQTMTQTIGTDIDGLVVKDNAKNKASQAAWIENQGRKEKDGEAAAWQIEGALVKQTTTQDIRDVNFNGLQNAKAMNVDSKLGIIADDLTTLDAQISKSISLDASSTVNTDADSTLDVDP